jgi:hypothetical protein
MVVGIYEELQVHPELVMRVVVVALRRGVLDCPVHPLDLPVGPGTVYLGEPALDVVLLTDAIKEVRAVPDVLPAWGELDTVVGQDRVNVVRGGFDQVAQELSTVHPACTIWTLMTRRQDIRDWLRCEADATGAE